MFSEGVLFAAIASIGGRPVFTARASPDCSAGPSCDDAGLRPVPSARLRLSARPAGENDDDEWLAASGLTFELDPTDAPDPQGRLTEGLSLPAGEYQVAASFQDRSPRTGDLMMALGGGHVLARVAGPLVTPMRLQFATPIEIPQLWVQVPIR